MGSMSQIHTRINPRDSQLDGWFNWPSADKKVAGERGLLSFPGKKEKEKRAALTIVIIRSDKSNMHGRS